MYYRSQKSEVRRLLDCQTVTARLFTLSLNIRCRWQSKFSQLGMLQTARWPVAKVKKDEKEVSDPMDGCMSDSDDSDPLDSVAEGNHDDTSIDEKDF